MIKAVFFIRSDCKNNIDKIYSKKSRQILGENTKLYPEIAAECDLNEHNASLKQTEVIFSTWGMPVLSREEIEKYFPELKAVFYAAGSVQAFARPFLEKNIRVFSAWAANAIPVAEYTAAQIILANKGFLQNTMIMKKDKSKAYGYSNSFPGNYDVRVGILGAGMIGRKVIELLRPYSIEVYVFDPYLSEEDSKLLGVIKCEIEEIFSTCQTISNHIANLPATVGMINGKLFDMMLHNATFINTGRGAQVIEKDLIKAMREYPDRTAILDVTYPEPPEKGSELYKLKNIVLSSHIAGSLGREVEQMGNYAVDEFIRYIKGEETRYEVNLKMLETMA